MRGESSSRPAGAEEARRPGTSTRLLYHIVFSTKHRANLIAAQLQPRLYHYLAGIVRGERGSVLDAHGIEYDERYLQD